MQITIPAADMRPQDLADIAAIHEAAGPDLIGNPYCDLGWEYGEWLEELAYWRKERHCREIYKAGEADFVWWLAVLVSHPMDNLPLGAD